MQIKLKHKPRKHQSFYLDNFLMRKYFALLADMGTGKTYMVLANAFELYVKGLCDALLVIAPNGVHHAWVDIEIPKHAPVDQPYTAISWLPNETKKEERRRAPVMSSVTPGLRIFTMNWEALQTPRGRLAAEQFLRSTKKAFIACDEADNMKNPKTARWKAMMQLRKYAEWRRIMTGTPIDGTPFSAFAQYQFLEPGLLGTQSYAAFKAEYAEMIPPTDPLMKAIMAKNRLNFLPQIVKRTPDGRPKYKNLDKLKRLLAPHSYRVMKAECLDLPDKIYKSVTFKLTKEQEKVYKMAANECRLMYGETPTAFNKLAIATKLAQITSGYYLHPDADEPIRIPGENPKINLVVARVAAALSAGHKVIVWARYTVQIQDFVAALKTLTDDDVDGNLPQIVEYHGGVSTNDRRAGVDAFEKGPANVFVGNQQAGGTGLTLVAASVVCYFSNNYSLRDRLQSEDRCHRIGQDKKVTYWDFAARGTVDEHAIRSIGQKKDVSDFILAPEFDIFDVRF